MVVDHLSKYSHYIALKHSYLVKDIAHIFAKEVVHLHGLHILILSNYDRVFISSFWKELHRAQGTFL